MRLAAFLACSLFSSAAFARDYSTYIGDPFTYRVNALAMDSAGNTYLTGGRAVIPPTQTSGALTDVFVTRLDSAGNIAQTFILSGKRSDQGNGIAVDGAGNIWVAGTTTSPDFPLHNPLQASAGVHSTGFLTKLSPDGAILFSTYLGGTQGESGLNAVAIDANGDAYVTGWTDASDYPRTPGLPAGMVTSLLSFGGVSAAFFAKISAAGDKILYAGGVSTTARECGAGSSCFLSAVVASGAAIAVDSSGNAYIAGNAFGGLPTTPGALRSDGIGAFVMKVNTAGTGLAYLTALGSANYIPSGAAPGASPGNNVSAIAADAEGNAYITGATSDPNFPATASVVQPVFSIPVSQIDPFLTPPADAFAAKLNPSGTAMVWATFLGGSAQDAGQSIAVDPSGNVWVSGTTASPDFPASGGIPKGPEFLVEFNPLGTELSFGQRFPANTVATAIAVDSAGTVHAAGSTGLVSTITPSEASPPRLFGIGNAAGSVLAGRVAPGELISIYGEHFGVANPVGASFNSAGFLPTTLAGVQVIVGGTAAPLLYVSDTQINAVAPSELTSPGDTQVQVTLPGAPPLVFRAVVDAVAPEVFRNADGSAAAINEDGSVNSAAHPATPGTVVAIWATGAGWLSGADGERASTAQFACGCTITTPVSQALNVTYAGPAPGLVNGVTQINFEIPSNVSGTLTFSLGVNAASSDLTWVFVSP